jgi:tetratricopeptide (TPR) repeat protein
MGVDGLLRLSLPTTIYPLPAQLLRLDIDLGEPGLGKARQQRRRGQLRAAEISLEQDALSAWLAGPLASRLRGQGVERLAIRLGQSAIAISAQILAGGRRVLLTARARLLLAPGPAPDGGPGGVVLQLHGVRVHGYTPTPAPLCGHLLLQALANGLPPGLPPWDPDNPQAPSIPSLDQLRTDPLRLALRALPRAGYRLPSLAGIGIQDLRLQEGRVSVIYAPSGVPGPTRAATPTSPHATLLSEPADSPLVQGDRQLLQGELEASLRLYEALAGGESLLSTAARLRCIQLLCCQPARAAQARALAEEELARNPQSAGALLALAALDAEAGQPEAAARHLRALSDLTDNTPEEAAAAALSAAELLLPLRPRSGANPGADAVPTSGASARSGPEAALALLERAAALPGGVPAARAASRLAEEYTRAGRHRDLASLEERQLSLLASAPIAERQRRYLRLGTLYLDQLDDPERAEAAIEQALRLDETSPTAWELRARLYERRAPQADDEGGQREALRSLCRAAELSPPDLAADLYLRAGPLAERVGTPDEAIECYRLALQAVPGHSATLDRLADLYLRLDRVIEAREAYEALLESAPGGELGNGLRRQALLVLSRVALSHDGDRARARGYLGRAMALSGDRDPEVLLAWATLEEADGRLDNLERTLARLEELGIHDQVLRRAEVLLLLGRHGEAAAAAERFCARYPHRATEALRVIVRARKSLGEARALREALERLAAQAPQDPSVRLDLGRALLTAGEAAAAREHLRAAADAFSGAGRVEALELLCEASVKRRDDEALRHDLRDLIATLEQGGDGSGPSKRALALGRLAEVLIRAQPDDEEDGATEAASCLHQAVALLADTSGPSTDPTAEAARLLVGEVALSLSDLAVARTAWDPLLLAPHKQGHLPQDPQAASRALRLGELSEAKDPAHPETALRYLRMALSLGAEGQAASRAWAGIIRLEKGKGAGEADALLEAAGDPSTDETPAARAALLCQAAALRQREGRTDEAIALYDRALGLDPEHLPALDALEALAEASDQPARLAEVLSRKARALPGRPAERKQVLARLGALYAERLDRRDLAREAYRQALALDPTFRPGLMFLLDDAHRRGDTGAELAHLKRLASLGDESGLQAADRAEIHARLAQLHRRAGRNEEAERQAQQALAYRPDHAVALQVLDERYTQEGRWEALCDVLLSRSAIEPDPTARHGLLLRRAQILDEKLRQPERALRAYSDLVRRAPDPASCIRLATLALSQGALEQVQDVAPVLGRTLLSSGRAEEAVRILEFSTRRGAGEPLFALLAEAYEAVGDHDHAADAWSTAGRTADPARHALALERAGRLEEAMAAWVSVASFEPQLGEEARARAVALARRAMTEQPDEAEAWARRLLEVDPADVSGLVCYLSSRPAEELPGIMEAQGRRLTREEAAASWLEVARALPDSLTAHRAVLLSRVIEVAPCPEAYLLYAGLCAGAARRELLLQALARFPADVPLTLALVEDLDPDEAGALIEDTLAGLPTDPASAMDRERIAAALLLGAARHAQAEGDQEEARALLSRALTEGGEEGQKEALHARVALDLPTLTQAAPGSAADLLPVLNLLVERGWATRDERMALARLLTTRGEHRAAARVQEEAGADPDDLLREVASWAPTQEQGGQRELLRALSEHAAARPQQARRLHRWAAQVAEALGDRRLCATLLEQAAFSLGTAEEEGALWAQAGSLWSALGERERGAAALGRALTAGGEKTPGVLLALGDYAYDAGDMEGASRHYRRALAVGQVPVAERGRLRMRLATIERRRGNAQAEEQELAAAVEAGAGALAWPALAALFRAQGEKAREGAALLAWADHETGAPRLQLLRQAAALVHPSLLPRVDDELTKMDADDEPVRDRIIARLRQQGDTSGLAQALVRDVEKSEGTRRLLAARELAEVSERLEDPLTTAVAFRVVLEGTDAPQEDCQRVLGWIGRMREAGVELPVDVSAALRGLLIRQGRLDEVIAQIDEQLRGTLPGKDRVQLMREAAELTESLGDSEGAALRWTRIAVAHRDEAATLRARRCLQGLCAAGRADRALQIIESELRRAGPAGAAAYGLRVAQAEVLWHLQRGDEAIGQLELVLVLRPEYGPAHALLGLVLVQSQQLVEIERSLPHLLRAARAKDVDPAEAGECALLAAECLMRGFRQAGGEEAPSATPESLLALAAEHMPLDRRPLEGMLRLSIGVGEHERAVLLIERILDLLPDEQERARLLVDQSHLLRHLGREAQAEGALQEALSLWPESPAAQHALRDLYIVRGELDRAEALCRRELQSTEDPAARVELLLDLGQLRERRGDPAGALSLYRQAGELGAAEGWQRVTRFHAEREEWLAAADAAGRAAELVPEEARGLLFIDAAELAIKAEDEGRARDYLGRAVALGQSAADIAQHRLHQLDGGSDPRDRRRFLLQRLDEAQGLARIDLLRRLLLLAREMEDDEATLQHAAALLALQPADELAYTERRRVLEARGDAQGLCDLFTAYAAALPPGSRTEQADALCQAAALREGPLHDPEGAAACYEQALRAVPDHVEALLGLAGLHYRRGEYEAARVLYAGVQAVPLDRPDAAEILEHMAQLFDAAGDESAAARVFGEMLALGQAGRRGPLVIRAAEELTRIEEQRGDYEAALQALLQVLPYLPDGSGAEATERRVQVRLHLSWLATQIGDTAGARRHLQYLLVDNPTHRDGLTMLLEVHRRCGEMQQAAEVLDRLVRLSRDKDRAERADLIFERAQIFETHLNEPDRALDLYQQAADIRPGHAPTLRRLIACYLREANGVGVAETVRELLEAGRDLDEARVLGGIGLALAGDDEQADALLLHASPEALAEGLCAVGLPPPGDLSILDEPIAAAVRALGGTAALEALVQALQDRLAHAPHGLDMGARRVLGRLSELRGEPVARVHLGVLALLDPTGYARQRLEELGPEARLSTLREDPMPEAGKGPLLTALRALAPPILAQGLPGPALQLSQDWGIRLRSVAQAVGLPRLDVAVVESLGEREPARCDALVPPRLRLARWVTADPAQARFAALRAVHLYLSGVPLIQGRGPEEVRAILLAAGHLLLGAPPPLSPLGESWLAELRALAPRPEDLSIPRAQREAVERALREIASMAPAELEDALPLLLSSVERAAERLAWAETGDLLAALRVLAGPAQKDFMAALRQPALSELVAFADRQHRS